MSAPVYIQAATTKNRPMGRLDAQGRVIPSTYEDLAFQAEYDTNNPIYLGRARPGASTSDAVWKISKQAFDGSSNLTSITWPEDDNGAASNDYQFVWDDRATYTYS